MHSPNNEILDHGDIRHLFTEVEEQLLLLRNLEHAITCTHSFCATEICMSPLCGRRQLISKGREQMELDIKLDSPQSGQEELAPGHQQGLLGQDKNSGQATCLRHAQQKPGGAGRGKLGHGSPTTAAELWGMCSRSQNGDTKGAESSLGKEADWITVRNPRTSRKGIG